MLSVRDDSDELVGEATRPLSRDLLGGERDARRHVMLCLFFSPRVLVLSGVRSAASRRRTESDSACVYVPARRG